MYGFAEFTQLSALLFVPFVKEVYESICIYSISIHNINAMPHYPWHDGEVFYNIVLEHLCSQYSYLSEECMINLFAIVNYMSVKCM